MRKMKNSYKVGKALNAILCVALLIIIMRCAYNEWSKYGAYTIWSFVVSLFMHGTLSGMIYLGIDWLLKKFLNEDE